MDKEHYKQRHASFLIRLLTAQKAKCPRTVAARLRDMAALKTEYDGSVYEENKNYFQNLYCYEKK